MKQFLLLAVITALPVLNGNAQCVSRPYTPEWDWRGPSKYTIFTKDPGKQPNTIESPWFAEGNPNENIDVACSKIL